MLLALDIGGTKVTLATFASGPGGLVMGAPSRLATADYPSLEALLLAHFGGQPPTGLTAVAAAVAGPVLGRQVQLTNLPWIIDADQIAATVGTPVLLLNDLEAHGYGVAHLTSDQLVTLQAGRPRSGNRAVIAAGTGLGEAILFRVGDGWQASAGEGGHCDFSPVSGDDRELLQFLAARYEGGHVSWERVVSGIDGFRNLYDFLLASGRIQPPAAVRAALAGQQDLGMEVIKAAAAGEAFAAVVLAWFVRLYGVEAGNLALKALAVGGVYVAGGIAPRILPWLTGDGFLAAFNAKGRLAPMLAEVPVHVVTDPYLALRGAARYALRSPAHQTL